MMTEQMSGGYTGKILRVNLSNKNISVEKPDDKFYRRYFGGTALIGYYLLKEQKPGIDPLGPDNKLIFSAEKIGHDAAEYAMQIKGQELSMHEPRGKGALGIG